MAKKITNLEKKNQPPIEEDETFLGVDMHFFSLILYVGGSVLYYAQPSPMIPAVFWLLSLLTYQFAKQSFLRFHALQSAGINIIAVFLRFVVSSLSSLLIDYVVSNGGTEIELLKQAQVMGWVSTAVTVFLFAIQIYGSEMALRGQIKEIPIVSSLGRKMAALFFGVQENDK